MSVCRFFLTGKANSTLYKNQRLCPQPLGLYPKRFDQTDFLYFRFKTKILKENLFWEGEIIIFFFLEGGGVVDPTIVIIVLKRTKKIFLVGYFSFFWGVGVVPPPKKIYINLPWTYEKLPCKGEPDRSSGQRDPLLQTNKQTNIVLLCIIDQQLRPQPIGAFFPKGSGEN